MHKPTEIALTQLEAALQSKASRTGAIPVNQVELGKQLGLGKDKTHRLVKHLLRAGCAKIIGRGRRGALTIVLLDPPQPEVNAWYFQRERGGLRKKRSCATCNEPLPRYVHTYCSSRCRPSLPPRQRKVRSNLGRCVVCDHPLTGMQAKFCSVRCKSRHPRRITARVGVCARCGKSFPIQQRHTQIPSFCSEQCRHHRKHEPCAVCGPTCQVDSIPLNCEICGKAFHKNHGGQKTCGADCKRILIAQVKGEAVVHFSIASCAFCRQSFIIRGRRSRNTHCKRPATPKPAKPVRLCLDCPAILRSKGERCAPCREKRKPSRLCVECSAPLPKSRKKFCTPCKLRRKGSERWTISRTARKEIYARDRYICQLCGDPTTLAVDANHPEAPSLDHILPRSKGGTDDPSNLRTAHRRCNWDEWWINQQHLQAA